MHIVRRHLLVAAIVLLASQGMGVLAMAQAGAGTKIGSMCTCGCRSISPDHRCPMCARMQEGSRTCDCAARGTRDVALPWWLDVVALLPAPAPISHTVAFASDVATLSSALSDVSSRPPSPPPKPAVTAV